MIDQWISAENGMVGQITVLANETTVVDIIVGSENHNTLETAVVTAGLVETLSGRSIYLFAPRTMHLTLRRNTRCSISRHGFININTYSSRCWRICLFYRPE